MAEEAVAIVTARTISRRGRAMQLTLPTEVVEALGIKRGDRFMVLVDRERNEVRYRIVSRRDG